MKQLRLILSFLIVCSVFLCCKRDIVEEKVVADFTYEVADSNYTVPVRILFTNKSTGAQLYQWTFEGGSISSYDRRDPGVITFDQPGTVKIILVATKDQLRSEKIITITLDSLPKPAFSSSPVINYFGITDFTIANQSSGGLTQFSWSFPGGIPASFEGMHPPSIRYNLPGDYRILLQARNARGRLDTTSRMIKVLPALAANFDIVPSFDDEDDYQAPLTAILQNASTSVTSHSWSAPGGILNSSTDSLPTVRYNSPGTYTVTYKASNGKDSAVVTKTIVVKANTRMRTFTNVKLGINTAQSSLGNYFSTSLRTVIRKPDVNTSNGSKIDIAFYGLNESFNYNLFFSPVNAVSLTFDPIPGATATRLINSQELCNCGINYTVADFDGLIDGGMLNAVPPMVVNAGGLTEFNSSLVPRIVLFENAAGKKGVIKIKQYVADGLDSYILCDIKVQKD